MVLVAVPFSPFLPLFLYAVFRTTKKDASPLATICDTFVTAKFGNSKQLAVYAQPSSTQAHHHPNHPSTSVTHRPLPEARARLRCRFRWRLCPTRLWCINRASRGAARPQSRSSASASEIAACGARFPRRRMADKMSEPSTRPAASKRAAGPLCRLLVGRWWWSSLACSCYRYHSSSRLGTARHRPRATRARPPPHPRVRRSHTALIAVRCCPRGH